MRFLNLISGWVQRRAIGRGCNVTNANLSMKLATSPRRTVEECYCWSSKLGRMATSQYTSRSGLISCRMVVEISSMDLVVVDSQRMPARRIMASASLTSMRQFSSDA